MIKDYSGFACEELREMILSDELGHKYMTEDNYMHLLGYENGLDVPNPDVISFCTSGLKRFGKYKGFTNSQVHTVVIEPPEIDHIKLYYEELRQLILDGELQHEYITDEDYELLLDYEAEHDTPSLSVLDFCTASRERFEERKKRDKKKNVIDDYRKIHYEDLRKMVLNGEVEHKYMTEAKYEYLYDNETSHSSEVDINNQNSSEFIDHYLILDFCTNGLRRFDKYKGLADFEIFTRFMTARVERENAERDVLRSFYKNPIRKNKLAMVFLAPIAFLLTVFRQPKLAMQTMINLFSLFYKRHKAVAVAAIAVITSVFLITVSSALGYSFIELIRSAFSSSEKFATDNDGNEIILADTRFYNSIDEMLEAEKLSILFPVNLPHGYNFTDFEITDFNTDLELRIYATNPYIMFIVRIGANNQIESYSYEANGIKYNIVKMDDGLYQAEWNNNEDYYTIAVSDKAILSEIIKNLKEN